MPSTIGRPAVESRPSSPSTSWDIPSILTRFKSWQHVSVAHHRGRHGESRRQIPRQDGWQSRPDCLLQLYGNKIITTGGGGMIVTNNEEWARRAKHP